MEQGWYVIEVRESIPETWSGWLAGLAIQALPAGGSRLSGVLVDQAALHGVLAKLRDLNLTLVTVMRLDGPLPIEGVPG